MTDIQEIRRKTLAAIVERDGLASAARRFGKPDRQINDMIAGRKSFGEKVARAMESAYDPSLPSGWLDGVKKPAKQNTSAYSTEHKATEIHAREPGDDFVAVDRVLFKLSAGCTGYQVEHIEGNGPPVFFRRDWIERHNYNPSKLLAVKINGSSMEPGLYDSDMVVINTQDVKPQDGDVFAANYEGELVIKRLKRDSGEWWLSSDNPDKRRFPDKRCDSGVILLGRIIYKQSERI